MKVQGVKSLMMTACKTGLVPPSFKKGVQIIDKYMYIQKLIKFYFQNQSLFTLMTKPILFVQ